MKYLKLLIISFVVVAGNYARARDDGSIHVSKWSLFKKQITFSRNANFKINPISGEVVKRARPWTIFKFNIKTESFSIPVTVYPDSLCFNDYKGEYNTSIFYSALIEPNSKNHFQMDINFHTAWDCGLYSKKEFRKLSCTKIKLENQEFSYTIEKDLVEHIITSTQGNNKNYAKFYVPTQIEKRYIPFCNGYFNY